MDLTGPGGGGIKAGTGEEGRGMSAVRENRVKRALRAGEKTCGAWLHLCSPISAEIMAHAGFDWLMVDLEHSPCDYQTLMALYQAASATPAVPLARAPWNDFVAIKRILDCGAYGVMIPWVNTKEEAAAAVAACKYPPKGIRGLANTRPTGWTRYTKEYVARANDEIMVILQIETMEAVRNIDDILSVPDIDVVFIGPADLSTSTGHPLEVGHPEVQAAMATIEQAALARKIALGTVSGTWEQAKALYDKGYQFVSLASDAYLLARSTSELVSNFRKTFGPPGDLPSRT